MLIEERRDASLHLFIANLGAMRKQLFPSLLTAYEEWLSSGDRSVMAVLVQHGVEHWRETARHMLALHERFGDRVASKIASEVEAASL